MKKISYIVLFLIFAMNVTAQSVWDGKREAIINGAGTENDPYLIENAQQFAWLVYVVNWDYSIWTKDKHFLLTTDIDLDGSVDNQWIPIGAGPSAYSKKSFDGVFDGGFHKITGIYIDNDNAVSDNNSIWVSTYVGFFSELGLNAVVKNLYLEGFIVNNRISGGFSGNNGNFEYCISDVYIESDNNASAGISAFGSPYMTNCANLGNITGKNGVGGIAGMNGVIENCYNIGTIKGENMIGGIAGRGYQLKNCYNVGEVSYNENSTNVGAIVGNKPSGGSVTNCHYLEGCIAQTNEYGEPQTAEFMRSQEFVNILNNDTDVWAYDEDNTNDGYPVFGNTMFGIEDIITDFPDMVMVYPNPVVDKVFVVGDVTSCEIYDLVGKRVKSISTNMEEIRVSDLQSGIYMMQFLTKTGNVVTRKIVKQ